MEWLIGRIAHWRGVYAAEARLQPTGDEAQARDAVEQERRHREGMDRIARAVAKTGAWFPQDD